METKKKKNIKGDALMSKREKLSWRMKRYNDLSKVSDFLKDNDQLTLSQMQEITKIPKVTISRLANADKKKLQNAKWENINKLAQLSDKTYIEEIMGDRPEIITKAIDLLIDERIVGDDNLANTLKEIIKSDPLAIAEIAKKLDTDQL